MLRPLFFAVIALVAGALSTSCGGRNCVPYTSKPVGAFCAPATAAADQSLTLQVIEQCGGCGDSITGCEVDVSTSNVTLRLVGQRCDPPQGTGCTLACRISTINCAVPALAAGSYTVSVEGQPDRSMTVAAGGATSCVATP